MSKNPKTLPVHWMFGITCSHCGTSFVVEADPQVGLLPNRNRMFLLTVPNECPECHSMHLVNQK